MLIKANRRARRQGHRHKENMAELPTAERLRKTIQFDDIEVARAVCGERDAHLRWLEQRLGLQILARGQHFHVLGPAVEADLAIEILGAAQTHAQRGHGIDLGTFEDLLRQLALGRGEPWLPEPMGIKSADFNGKVRELAPHRRKALPKTDEGEWLDGARLVQPRSDGQRLYVEAIRSHDLTFGIGPAGSGKTWLAVASALAALQRREIKKIVLTRPAVEAGEHLGFLPGDLREKVSPYLQPLHDALGELIDVDKVERLVERGQIEAAPLAFMRGRTLANAFVILDEAQNCTAEQLLMVMTRIGEHTKMVITGDPSQTDLQGRLVCGLEHAARVTGTLPGVAVVRLGHGDVVRHPLVAAIAKAWSEDREQEQRQHHRGARL
jgi:phosphate starvation-inducible PhoH-like protein